MRRWVLAVIALSLVSLSCGSSSGDNGSAGAEGGLFERCDPNARLPQAPDDWYRDRPRYVGNEQPTDAVRSWAQAKSGFQELWVDRERNGWVTVAFSDDAESRQRELEQAFPDVGVVAVEVDWQLAALRELQREVGMVAAEQEIAAGIGVSLASGTVELQLGILSVSNLSAFERFAGQPLCVSGRDPDGAVTGPQASAGDGWRLLVIDGSARRPPATLVVPPPTPGGLSLGTRIEIATNGRQLATMWDLATRATDGGLRPDEPVPAVDFGSEIVVLGSQLESGSCPELLSGVDVEQDVVTVRTQVSDDTVGCTADGNPLTWAVAVERSVLPAPPFSFNGPATLEVVADLRPDGAVVDDARTVSRAGDEGLLPGFDADPRGPGVPAAAPTPVPPGVLFPHIVEPGFPSNLAVPIECLTALGPINGFTWVPDAPTGAWFAPDVWLAAVDPGTNRLVVDLLLAADPAGDPTLDVGANGQIQRYVIGEVAPAC